MLQGMDQPELAVGVRSMRGRLQRRGDMAAGIAGAPKGEPGLSLRVYPGSPARVAHRSDGGNVLGVGGRPSARVRRRRGPVVGLVAHPLWVSYLLEPE